MENILSQNEKLQYAIDNGLIDLKHIQDLMDMENKSRTLKEHPYSVYEGKDGLWYTSLPDGEKGRVKRKRKTKVELENVIYEFWNSKKNVPYFKDVFDGWTQEKLGFKEMAQSTFDRYKCDYDRFFADNKFIKIPFGSIQEEDIDYFVRSTIAENNLTQKAYSGVRTILNGTFQYAKRKKLTTLSISFVMADMGLSTTIFALSMKDRKNQVYQEDELPIMIEYLKSNIDIWNLGILLTFQTGIRVGELSTLKKTDKQGSLMHIQRTEVKYRHTDNKYHREVKGFPKSDAGVRYVILTESAAETFDKIILQNPFGEYLLENKGKRICGSGFDKRIGKLCTKLGFNRKSMHKIRKTYGTILIDSGADDSTTMEQMGHKDITTTKKYYYFSNKNDKSKLEQISRAGSYIG